MHFVTRVCDTLLCHILPGSERILQTGTHSGAVKVPITFLFFRCFSSLYLCIIESQVLCVLVFFGVCSDFDFCYAIQRQLSFFW